MAANPAFGQRHHHTQELIDLLRQAAIGDLVSYEQIREKLGIDPQGLARAHLSSARRHLLRYDQMLFHVETDIGLRRVAGPDVFPESDRHRASARRQAIKAMQALTAVGEFDQLGSQERVGLLTRQSQLGAIVAISDQKAQKKLEDKVQQSSERLPVGKTLEAFK